MTHHRYIIVIFFLTVLFSVAETQIHIKGMTTEGEREVFNLMGGRLVHVTNNPASPSRADDAAFLVRQVFQKEGYARVQVKWDVANRSEIILSLDKGERLSLGKVTVTGVPSSEARKLSKLYARPAEKDRPIISKASPFREEDVATGLNYIRQELNAEGYWNVHVDLTERSIDSDTGMVNLTIHVKQGALSRINDVEIISPDRNQVSIIHSAIEPYINKTANTENLNSMRLTVEELFMSDGYPDANIMMGLNHISPQFVPTFHINLGKRVRIRDIRASGLLRTKPNRVETLTRQLEGNWYDEVAMNKRIRSFLGSGAFSSARVEINDTDQSDYVDVTLQFEETKAKDVSIAAGFDSYYGPILRTTYTDRNLRGELLGFSSGFEFSSRGVLGENRLTNPWLFGSDITGTGRIFALVDGREGFSTYSAGFDGTTTWVGGDHYIVDLLAGYSLVNINAEGLPTYELGETVYAQPRLRLTQAVDFRDNDVLPTKGWHLAIPLEVGAAVGDCSSSYALAEISGAWYRSLSSDYQVILGGACGFIIPSGDSSDFPINLRQFNGGARSVRSFPERELGPRVDGYPIGGEAAWHANAELIRSIIGSLKAVTFFDAGGISQQYDRLESSNIDLAVGFGLRLDSPVGPIRVEYGYNLTRAPDEPVGTIHFAIGVAF